MKIYQCITIGIHQYHFFAPLPQAEADATAIYQFLRREANLTLSQVLHLADHSPRFRGQGTAPKRDNLLYWCRRPENLSPITHLWLFFRGYGVNFDGEDYLLSLDSHPLGIPQTAIKLKSLFTALKQWAAPHTFVILDLSYPPNLSPVSKQALAMARQLEITLILSPQSPKSQGILTVSLLEALRHYGPKLTLNLLDRYLGDRFPELMMAQNLVCYSTPSIISPNVQTSFDSFFPVGAPVASRRLDNSLLTLPRLPDPPQLKPFQFPSHPQPQPIDQPIPKQKPRSFWSEILVLCLLLGLLWQIIALIFFRPSVHLSSLDDYPGPLKQARISLARAQASDFNRAIKEARKVKPDDLAYAQAQADISRWSQNILDIAQGRAAEGDFQGAIAAASLVPTDQEELYQITQKNLKTWQNKYIKIPVPSIKNTHPLPNKY